MRKQKHHHMLLCLIGLLGVFTCYAWAATADYTKDVHGTVTYKDGVYTASYSGVTASNQYVLMVVKSGTDLSQLEANSNAVVYIDQKTADKSTITFDFIPKSVPECAVYLGGSFAGETSPILLGTLDAKGVTLSGTALSWNDIDNARYLLYDADKDDATIREDVVKDTPELALSHTATTETPVATGVKKQYKQDFSLDSVVAGSYKLAIFKPGKYVPAIVEVNTDTTELWEVQLRLYGDVNGDGTSNGRDITQILRYSVGARDFTEDEFLAANVNGDKAVNGRDITQILRYSVGGSSKLDDLP